MFILITSECSGQMCIYTKLPKIVPLMYCALHIKLQSHHDVVCIVHQNYIDIKPYRIH